MFAEVAIECESMGKFQTPHDFETRTVYHAQAPTVSRQKGAKSCCMEFRCNPVYLKDGDYSFLKTSDSFHAKSTLDECKTFQENVIRAYEPNGLVYPLEPGPLGSLVIFVVSIQKSVKCGGVYEDIHPSYESVKYSSCLSDTSDLPEWNFPTTDRARLRRSSTEIAPCVCSQ